MNPEECVFGLSCWLLFPFVARFEMFKWGTEKPHPRCQIGWHRQTPCPFSPCPVLFLKQKPQRLPFLLCVLRPETMISAEQSCLGHFCCCLIYEHQLFLILGIPAMTTMWVGPICGTDSWHSRRLMSQRPEEGSDLEQLLGFSLKFYWVVFLDFGLQLM